MNKKLNVALVGCGAVAEYYHLPVLQRMPEYEIKYLVDLSKNRAESVMKRFRLSSKVETKYTKILDDDQLDAVLILTPPTFHKEQIFLAAEAGKAVFCEKPLSMNTQDAKDIIDVCERNGVKLLPGYQMRFDGKFSKIKEMIEKKMFGSLIGGQGLHFANAFEWPSVSKFQIDEQKGGGALFEMMHFVDLATWFFGKALSMTASIFQKKKKSSIDDTANLHLTFENDVSVALSIGWNTITVNSFTVYGTEGYLRALSDSKKLQYHAKNFLAQQPILIQPNHSVSPFQDELLHFYKTIMKDTSPIVTPEEIIQNAKIIESAYNESNKNKTIILEE
ncbi:MAG: Gfo/Idh/MocA family oxidoreductase [Candidatus Heimdallarchaeota archaeon]|nr:Gfo/Idh/MocA family oxidoreductase [Candidatus Heimdallarchaeota archaeon]